MDGILIVDKPNGPTSHDVVDLIRKKYGIKKVGHAGTLDPAATGVLIVLLGKATKLANRFVCLEKEYLATLTLGVSTDTADADGRQVETKKIPANLCRTDMENIIYEFIGDIKQVPPMFSALRHNGKRLYKLARKGITVPRKERTVNVKCINITDFNLPNIDFDIVCSKGTYIRCLCEDIARRLGCVGFLSRLRRIRCGEFGLDKAITLEAIRNTDGKNIKNFILDVTV